MHFEKNDIEEYLQGVWSAIDAGKYQIAPRPKNRELLTEYVISEKEVLDIIKSLTPMNFSTAVSNDHKGMEHEKLYIFGKDIDLLERFGNRERTVALYIKFNKISDQCSLFLSTNKSTRYHIILYRYRKSQEENKNGRKKEDILYGVQKRNRICTSKNTCNKDDSRKRVSVLYYSCILQGMWM